MAVIALIIADMTVILAYAAGVIVALWGVAHAVPTARVLAGLEPITLDSRRVVLQEWLAEAFTMRGVAAMVIVVTAVGDGPNSDVRVWVYRVAAGLLAALGALTGLTGARTAVVWFKICPFVLAGLAALLVVAGCCRPGRYL